MNVETKTKKLTLSRETVRQLTPPEMENVNGGIFTITVLTITGPIIIWSMVVGCTDPKPEEQ